MRGMIELSSFDHWLSTSQLPFRRHARCELDHNPPEVSAPSIALSAWLGWHRKKARHSRRAPSWGGSRAQYGGRNLGRLVDYAVCSRSHTRRRAALVSALPAHRVTRANVDRFHRSRSSPAPLGQARGHPSPGPRGDTPRHGQRGSFRHSAGRASGRQASDRRRQEDGDLSRARLGALHKGHPSPRTTP